MLSFPLICNNERTSDWELFDQVRSRPIVRTPFENGAVQTRTRVTTSRWKFSVGANLMTTTLYNTLTAFFDANQGGAFDFIHPITGVTHEVRFSEDELPGAKPTGTGSNARWSISGIALEETAGSTLYWLNDRIQVAKGYILGGYTGAGRTAVIEDLIFSSETSQAIAATLDTAKRDGAGVQYGYV